LANHSKRKAKEELGKSNYAMQREFRQLPRVGDQIPRDPPESRQPSLRAEIQPKDKDGYRRNGKQEDVCPDGVSNNTVPPEKSMLFHLIKQPFQVNEEDVEAESPEFEIHSQP